MVSRLFRRDYSLPFPSSPCNVRIVKGDRIVRCAVFESRNECISGAREEGFVVVRGKRCAIYEPTVYIYGYVGRRSDLLVEEEPDPAER